MKLTKQQGTIVNKFKKDYLKSGQLVCWGYTKYSKTTKEHQDRVNDICWWLYSNGIPFATEVEFRKGANPDIICPTIRKIYEVRHSEKEFDSMNKLSILPEELHEWVVYSDTNKAFNYKDLL